MPKKPRTLAELGKQLEDSGAPALGRLAIIAANSGGKPTVELVGEMAILYEAAKELTAALNDMAQMLTVGREDDVTGIYGTSLLGSYWSGYRRALIDIGFGRYKKQVELIH